MPRRVPWRSKPSNGRNTTDSARAGIACVAVGSGMPWRLRERQRAVLATRTPCGARGNRRCAADRPGSGAGAPGLRSASGGALRCRSTRTGRCARAAMQPAGGGNVRGDGLRRRRCAAPSARARCGGCATMRTQCVACRCGLAGGSAAAGEFKGRHPQMPVRTVALDRSNKWDHLRQVRLSAAWQTCTVLSARLSVPWVFQLGSRGNPAHLSNTAGDACSHCTPNVRAAVPGIARVAQLAHSSSCCPFSSADSTRSRSVLRR